MIPASSREDGHSVENPGDHPVAVTVSSELDDLVDTLSPLIRADLVQSNANLFLATVGNNIAPRGLTAPQISVFEGKSTANEYINCYEPTFDDEHNIALALGYPLAQFIKQSNAGADSVGQGKVILLWAERIKQLVTINLSSVTVDTLVRELVVTLKTDMSKNIAAACPDLRASITGLPLASAACQ